MTAALAYRDDTFQASSITTMTRMRPSARQQLSPAPVAFGEKAPNWPESVALRMAELMHLAPGWDGYAGKAISPSAAAYAFDILARTMLPGLPPPWIVPLSYGGVQLEWHRKGWDIEIEIPGPGRLYLLTRDIAADHERELELRADLSQLSLALSAIQD